MDQESFSRYMSGRYEDQIGWYDRKAVVNEARYLWMQWILIVLAAVTPVLIQLKDAFFGISSELATVSSALVVILTAGLKAFRYQENWMNYRTTCESLKKERYLYEARIGEYGAADDRNKLFIERVEGLISRENTVWITTHQSQRQEKSEKSETLEN